MEIGTVKPIEKREEEETVKSGIQRTSPSGSKSGGADDGGNGDNGRGDGGNGGPKRRAEDPGKSVTPEKSRVLMWFLLMVVIMTFSGLIGAYIVISTNAALEWRPFSLPPQVWVSTAVILASSLTYQFGKRSLARERYDLSKRWFLATTVLGAMFISSQVLAWLALVNRGFYLSGNPYAGFFYILTAVHAVHVIGGICALGYILLRTWYPPASRLQHRKQVTDATVTGWYWHTMDLLWLVLLFLLGFWK